MQHMVHAVKLPAAFHGNHILRLCHHTNHPGIPQVVITNGANFPVRQILAHRAGVNGPFCMKDRFSEALRFLCGKTQHMKGQAADIDIQGDMAFGKKIFEYIKNNLPFDQLIWEHNAKGVYWVHVSFVYFDFGRNRKQVIDNLLKK